MSKLIFSEFYRHFHSKFLWICCLLLILSGGFLGTQIDHFEYFDDIYVIPLSIIISAYFSAEIGTEYNNRTLHNKIICGYKRAQIYFVYIITGVVISSFLLLTFILPIIIISHSFLATFPFSAWSRIIVIYWFLCLIWAVFGIISVVISSSKVIGCILSLAVIFGLYAGAYVAGRFAFQPEFIEEHRMESVEMTPEEVRQVQEGTFVGSYGWTEAEDGSIIYRKDIMVENIKTPNPYYVPKPYSTVLKQLVYLMPQGQINISSSYLYTKFDPNDNGEYDFVNFFPLYSLADLLLFCSVGLYAFRKKDLK